MIIFSPLQTWLNELGLLSVIMATINKFCFVERRRSNYISALRRDNCNGKLHERFSEDFSKCDRKIWIEDPYFTGERVSNHLIVRALCANQKLERIRIQPLILHSSKNQPLPAKKRKCFIPYFHIPIIHLPSSKEDRKFQQPRRRNFLFCKQAMPFSRLFLTINKFFYAKLKKKAPSIEPRTSAS